jgi:multidrug efflux pump subunit AcrA (membrane-fusion protein)
LAWFDVPQNNNSGAEAKADIYSNFAGAEHHWQGQLVRTEGQIDPKSRMVHVVAQVTDPFKTESGRPPLVPGMFVRVDIQGKEVKSIFRLPRYAIRRGAEVWVARGSGETKELAVLPVEIIRMDRDFAYIDSGLDEGDFVITSALETVTDGMAIRIHVDDEAENQ